MPAQNNDINNTFGSINRKIPPMPMSARASSLTNIKY